MSDNTAAASDESNFDPATFDDEKQTQILPGDGSGETVKISEENTGAGKKAHSKILEEPTQPLSSKEIDQKQTQLQNAPAAETDKTKPFFESETGTNADNPKEDLKEENALRPSKLRFALLCLLFLLTFFSAAISTIDTLNYRSMITWDLDFDLIAGETSRINVIKDEKTREKLEIADEVLEINGQPLKKEYVYSGLERLEPDTAYTLKIRRGGQEQEVELRTVPLPLDSYLLNIAIAIFFPTGLLLTALFVFLLKPNDKLALLLTLMFCFLTILFSSTDVTELPALIFWITKIARISSISFFPVFLHFFMIFPKAPRFVGRFPKIQWLIYFPLPLILYVFILTSLKHYEVISTSNFLGSFIFDYSGSLPLAFLFLFAYFLGGCLFLLFNYFSGDKDAKRKIRFIVTSIILGSSCLFIIPALDLFLYLSGSSLTPQVIESKYLWLFKITTSFILLIPISFAYAILKHKVIPVSFVIRRGLQYLLARNALRLLLLLSVLGIVWNVAAAPNRTLSEILFNNSFGFYFSFLFAAGLLLLNRLGLREWIDKRFFREQYNQEKILRELTVAVKETDSLPKLSRLVSSQIQAALHPENVYLFFRDDKRQSDFSLGYTTNEKSESSSNLKLSADSPLLKFMQSQKSAVEFPDKKTDELPYREKNWLTEIKANLLVPMHGTDGKLAGFFSLGEKLSEIPYTGRDKELLETLAHQIALVYENLSLREKVRKEQKIKTEVLARIDERSLNLLKECPHCGRCFDRSAEKCADDNSELTFSLPVERTIENRYRLEKLIGKGGMGAVYEAADLRINRLVAVKILSGAMFGNREALRRFEREAQTAGQLQHPNIVLIHDYGTLSTEGAYLVMQLLKGKSLRQILDEQGGLRLPKTVNYFSQILDGLEAAHKKGIVHRDLKPDNVFIVKNETDEERPIILDFGIARINEPDFAKGSASAKSNMTVPGTIIGTFGYMPPEQLKGEQANERSDLFSIGVMIYESIMGEKPFRGNSQLDLLKSMMTEEFISVLDEPLKSFFKTALAKDTVNRFSSAGEMKRQLLSVVASSI